MSPRLGAPPLWTELKPSEDMGLFVCVCALRLLHTIVIGDRHWRLGGSCFPASCRVACSSPVCLAARADWGIFWGVLL